MLAAGALEEAEAVAALGLSPGAPGLKPVGAAELVAHVRGEMPLAEAAERARAATRAYAKRQQTWFANQMADWPRLPAGAGPEAALAL
jgi:tRNA dimethylallyltransferase